MIELAHLDTWHEDQLVKAAVKRLQAISGDVNKREELTFALRRLGLDPAKFAWAFEAIAKDDPLGNGAGS